MDERNIYFLTKEDENLNILEILKRRFKFSSRLIRQLKNNNSLYLNGIPVNLKHSGCERDRLTVIMPKETSYFEPEDIPIDVIYEDQDLLVINKQPGIVVHPTKGHPSHTIANGIVNYMIEKSIEFKIRFINRLDRDTSGVLLIGKNSFIQDNLSEQMINGRTEKHYSAGVKGHFESEEGIIDLPIGRPLGDGIRRQVMAGGAPSVTEYKVLKRFAHDCSLMDISLKTGRTHQIRVHMSHIGHPVVGDALYGEMDENLIRRQALHGVSFSCDHPITGRRLILRASLPKDIQNLIQDLDKK